MEAIAGRLCRAEHAAVRASWLLQSSLAQPLLDAVVVDQRKAVDICLFCDGSRFCRACRLRVCRRGSDDTGNAEGSERRRAEQRVTSSKDHLIRHRVLRG